ncbi:MAG: hypothetical protein WDO24_14325 [Pseudomonadota bacterium]
MLATRVPDKSRHLARHRLADLFLDSFAFSAATTATDALWSGLPVLTKRSTAVSRPHRREPGVRRRQCPRWSRAMRPTYVERAIAIARDPALAAALRRDLAARLPTAAYFDAARFTRQLETGLLAAWQRHVDGLPAASFDVAPIDVAR